MDRIDILIKTIDVLSKNAQGVEYALSDRISLDENIETSNVIIYSWQIDVLSNFIKQWRENQYSDYFFCKSIYNDNSYRTIDGIPAKMEDVYVNFKGDKIYNPLTRSLVDLSKIIYQDGNSTYQSISNYGINSIYIDGSIRYPITVISNTINSMSLDDVFIDKSVAHWLYNIVSDSLDRAFIHTWFPSQVIYNSIYTKDVLSVDSPNTIKRIPFQIYKKEIPINIYGGKNWFLLYDSTSIGKNHSVSGGINVAFNNENIINGTNSIAVNSNNIAIGSNIFIAGYNNITSEQVAFNVISATECKLIDDSCILNDNVYLLKIQSENPPIQNDVIFLYKTTDGVDRRFAKVLSVEGDTVKIELSDGYEPLEIGTSGIYSRLNDTKSKTIIGQNNLPISGSIFEIGTGISNDDRRTSLYVKESGEFGYGSYKTDSDRNIIFVDDNVVNITTYDGEDILLNTSITSNSALIGDVIEVTPSSSRYGVIGDYNIQVGSSIKITNGVNTPIEFSSQKQAIAATTASLSTKDLYISGRGLSNISIKNLEVSTDNFYIGSTSHGLRSILVQSPNLKLDSVNLFKITSENNIDLSSQISRYNIVEGFNTSSNVLTIQRLDFSTQTAPFSETLYSLPNNPYTGSGHHVNIQNDIKTAGFFYIIKENKLALASVTPDTKFILKKNPMDFNSNIELINISNGIETQASIAYLSDVENIGKSKSLMSNVLSYDISGQNTQTLVYTSAARPRSIIYSNEFVSTSNTITTPPENLYFANIPILTINNLSFSKIKDLVTFRILVVINDETTRFTTADGQIIHGWSFIIKNSALTPQINTFSKPSQYMYKETFSWASVGKHVGYVMWLSSIITDSQEPWGVLVNIRKMDSTSMSDENNISTRNPFINFSGTYKSTQELEI